MEEAKNARSFEAKRLQTPEIASQEAWEHPRSWRPSLFNKETG
jgi:hypothetical protein